MTLAAVATGFTVFAGLPVFLRELRTEDVNWNLFEPVSRSED
jgi:hypothetical protein